MFWVCAEHKVDNIEMLLLLLSIAPCSEPRCFLLLTLPCWRGSWGFLGGWEETQLGQVMPIDQRDIPCDIIFRYKVGKEGRRGGLLEFWHFSSQVTVTPEMAEHLPAHRKE